MRSGHDIRISAFIIIASGCLLILASAVVPFFDSGDELHGSVLLVGLLPYVIYGFFTDVVRGWAVLIAGTLMLGIDLGVIIPERFLHYDGYTSGAIYYAALFSIVLSTAILGIGAYKNYRQCRGMRSYTNNEITGTDTENEK
ncbi:MAG: hypothetical protein ACYC9L_02190 [Sulfuricaulis sp.]